MQDFTLKIYKKLLHSLLANDYSFQTLENFIEHPNKEKIVILRHDVDRLPGNALKMAHMENNAGIKTSYFFRTVDQVFDETIIEKIVGLGHEIGYHYENLSEISRKSEDGGQRSIGHQTPLCELRTAGRRTRTGRDRGQKSEVRDQKWKQQDGWMNRMIRMVGWKQLDMEREKNKEEFRDKFFELAIDDFRLNLEKLRKLYSVKTICMHGSPLSKWDNRDLWKRCDYRDFGIIAEPYFDIDFDEVFYLTDTGRSWNNSNASIRDKVNSKFDIKIKDTHHLIGKIQNNELPDKLMLNIHPQRWFDYGYNWYKELLMQNVKNVVKRYLLKFRD